MKPRLIKVDFERHGIVAVNIDDAQGNYDVSQRLQASIQSAEKRPPTLEARALVEVQRRFGGIAPRALLGGQFVAGHGITTEFEVCVSKLDMLESEGGPTCSSQLWTQPFLVGLPIYLARGVMRGFTELTHTPLPPGVLTVDRAGFDIMNSAEPVFAQAASLLTQVLAGIIYERELEPAICGVVAKW